MANFFTCPECGVEFTAKDDPEKDGVVCPSCQVVIPSWAEPATDTELKPLTSGSGLSSRPEKPCPSCSTPAKMDAVICLQCGYNWTTGRVPTPERKTSSLVKDAVTFGLLLIIIGALAFAGFQLYQGRQQPDVAQTEPTTPISELPPIDIDDAYDEQRDDESMTADDVATQDDLDETADEEPATENATAQTADEAQLEAKVKEALARRMEKTRPLFNRGDQVALRRANGMMQRGTLLKNTETTVVLRTAEARVEIPLEELDHPTRLSHDLSYREKYITFQAKRLIKKKQQQGDPPDA